MNTFFFFIVRGHSPSPAPVRFICTIVSFVTPSGFFYPSLDPRPGTAARTVPILGIILEIVGRYQYRYNIH
jgi:hypothetical protein